MGTTAGALVIMTGAAEVVVGATVVANTVVCGSVVGTLTELGVGKMVEVGIGIVVGGIETEGMDVGSVE